jgi:hypothetical protein
MHIPPPGGEMGQLAKTGVKREIHGYSSLAMILHLLII